MGPPLSTEVPNTPAAEAAHVHPLALCPRALHNPNLAHARACFPTVPPLPHSPQAAPFLTVSCSWDDAGMCLLVMDDWAGRATAVHAPLHPTSPVESLWPRPRPASRATWVADIAGQGQPLLAFSERPGDVTLRIAPGGRHGTYSMKASPPLKCSLPVPKVGQCRRCPCCAALCC